MASRKPLGRRVLGNLRHKWVQVAIAVLVFALGFIAIHHYLGPRKASEAERKAKAYKFMHCDKCLFEMDYNAALAERAAQGCRCKEAPGIWEPTEQSIKTVAGDPYVAYYTALFVAFVVLLFVLYLLLARKDPTPDYYFTRCLHCRAILQFTPAELDALIECPNCEQPVRLPDEDEAMTAEDYQELHTDATLGQYEARLRAKGYVFPHEQAAEPPPDDGHPGGEPAGHTPEGHE